MKDRKYVYFGSNKETDEDPQINSILNAIYGIHGSGLNYDFVYWKKNNIIRVNTRYQVMNNNGYYLESTPVRIWIDINNARDFKLSVNEHTYRASYGLRDYLDNLIFCALTLPKVGDGDNDC